MKITYLQLVIAILFATFSHPTTSADPDPGTLIEGTMLQPGAAEEGIVYDPASGNYTVTYKVPDGLYQVVYYPRTKIAPTSRDYLWAMGLWQGSCLLISDHQRQ